MVFQETTLDVSPHQKYIPCLKLLYKWFTDFFCSLVFNWNKYSCTVGPIILPHPKCSDTHPTLLNKLISLKCPLGQGYPGVWGFCGALALLMWAESWLSERQSYFDHKTLARGSNNNPTANRTTLKTITVLFFFVFVFFSSFFFSVFLSPCLCFCIIQCFQSLFYLLLKISWGSTLSPFKAHGFFSLSCSGSVDLKAERGALLSKSRSENWGWAEREACPKMPRWKKELAITFISMFCLVLPFSKWNAQLQPKNYYVFVVVICCCLLQVYPLPNQVYTPFKKTKKIS